MFAILFPKLTPWPDPKAADYADAGYADIAVQHWDALTPYEKQGSRTRWRYTPLISR
jgi:hypothetical protein